MAAHSYGGPSPFAAAALAAGIWTLRVRRTANKVRSACVLTED